MIILLSNDDGYRAEGINILSKSLKKIARVIMFAPKENHSGASSSLSLRKDLEVTKISDDVFVVDELNSTYTIKDSEFLKLLTDTDSDGYGNSHGGRGEYFASSKLDDYKKTYEDFEDYQGTNEERSDLHIELPIEFAQSALNFGIFSSPPIFPF